MIECYHYQPWTKTGGKCLVGLYGGKPSHGTCERCDLKNAEIPEGHVIATVTRNKDKTCPTCKPTVTTRPKNAVL
jgi:hypothetical protein